MPRPPIFEWEGTEYTFKEKTADWYWAVGIIAVAAAIASLLFGNVILAILIIVAAASVAIAAAKQPRAHRFAVTEQGLTIGDRLYPYDTMLHYSVLEYVDLDLPPALSIKTRSLFAPHLLIPLVDVDPDEVYEYLSLHLDEGNHHTSVVDRLVEMFEL
ncbi:MAG TPA: hypothetical protein VHC20_00275 [Candidatus Paceibacterota bacterium]|nr:hypothetical protein [Candidatus Paceibacterota bacterium]